MECQGALQVLQVMSMVLKGMLCAQLPKRGQNGSGAVVVHVRVLKVILCAQLPKRGPCKRRRLADAVRTASQRRGSSITAFTSLRTNLSPFTKGCREWDASM